MLIRGRVWRFGDNVDTDAIIPGRYLNVSDPAVLAQHCMEGIDTEFVKRLRPGDVIVAGANFGCGSSREHAPIALKAAGVGAVVASSFARIFFRNAINIGLPVLESPEAVEALEEGREVLIDTDAGVISDSSTGRQFRVAPYPPMVRDILQAGGLMAWVKHQISAEGAGTSA